MQQRLRKDRLGFADENFVAGVSQVGSFALGIGCQKNDVDGLVHFLGAIDQTIAIALTNIVAGHAHSHFPEFVKSGDGFADKRMQPQG